MNRFFKYLSESRTELVNVSWPSRAQAARLTFQVVIFSIVLAVIVGVLDYGFTELLQRLILKVK